ncbi:MAG: SMR family transporter [Ottowia sp.]|uniref:SMR family transporter n=1 Tax=Ottowia sp. TaxID=1898956 RepID=UPI003C777968
MSIRPWLFLAAAVMVEVTGLIAMKLASSTSSPGAFLFMYTMIGLSFCFFSFAVKHLPVALTYAAWETCGLVLITVISLQFFGERLNPQKIAGMALLVTGVILVNAGSGKAASQ